MFDLRALGSTVLLTTDGREIDVVLAQPKRFALLVYLAMCMRYGATKRAVLLSLFWPERDEEHARQSLRQALRFLRRAVGAEALLNRGDDGVALNASMVRFDVQDFDDRLARGDL